MKRTIGQKRIFHNTRFAASSLILLALSSFACGDVLTLTDGTSLQGKIHKVDDHWVVTDAAGHDTEVSQDQIESFKLTGADHPDTDTPEARLASLRRITQGYSDLHLIIDRYNKFIATNTGDIADQARTDLATWQARLDEGCVKVGDRWLSSRERDQLGAVEAESASRVGDMIRENRMQDAADLLKSQLKDDPRNPSALYLQGIVLASQNQTAAARAAFEEANKVVPKRAATLNNLAVMLWRQRLYPAAMLNYAAAMTQDPANAFILNNVTEALRALPKENRDGTPTLKAIALFDEQEKALEKSQQAAGLARWGAAWVRADQLPQLEKEAAADEVDTAAMQARIDQVQSAIVLATNQINSDQQLMSQMASQQQPAYANGSTTQIPVNLPNEYSRLADDVTVFTNARQTSIEQLHELQIKASHMQSHLSIPKFTGLQRLFGPEQTPIRTESPATRPG